MILPIVLYGDPVLRKKAEIVSPDFPQIKELIISMFETMYGAQGVGIAAPQVGIPIRMFVIDAAGMNDRPENIEDLTNFKRIFINPIINSEEGEKWSFEEGCLSIPGIREEVIRYPQINITYQNEKFETLNESFIGLKARIIQHEYDHIEGILFTDHISSLRKQLNKTKMNRIQKGEMETDYPVKVYSGRKR